MTALEVPTLEDVCTEPLLNALTPLRTIGPNFSLCVRTVYARLVYFELTITKLQLLSIELPGPSVAPVKTTSSSLHTSSQLQ